MREVLTWKARDQMRHNRGNLSATHVQAGPAALLQKLAREQPGPMDVGEREPGPRIVGVPLAVELAAGGVLSQQADRTLLRRGRGGDGEYRVGRRRPMDERVQKRGDRMWQKLSERARQGVRDPRSRRLVGQRTDGIRRTCEVAERECR